MARITGLPRPATAPSSSTSTPSSRPADSRSASRRPTTRTRGASNMTSKASLTRRTVPVRSTIITPSVSDSMIEDCHRSPSAAARTPGARAGGVALAGRGSVAASALADPTGGNPGEAEDRGGDGAGGADGAGDVDGAGGSDGAGGAGCAGDADGAGGADGAGCVPTSCLARGGLSGGEPHNRRGARGGPAGQSRSSSSAGPGPGTGAGTGAGTESRFGSRMVT